MGVQGGLKFAIFFTFKVSMEVSGWSKKNEIMSIWFLNAPLTKYLQQEWKEIQAIQIRKICASAPNGLKAIAEKGGGFIEKLFLITGIKF